MRSNPDGTYDLDFEIQSIDDYRQGQATNVPAHRAHLAMQTVSLITVADMVPVMVTEAQLEQLKAALASQLNDAWEAVGHYIKRFGEKHPMTLGAKAVCEEMNALFAAAVEAGTVVCEVCGNRALTLGLIKHTEEECFK
jgi:hypothetical protein